MSNRSEAKICDESIARVVYEDIWLGRCQYDGETRFGTATHSLKVPVSYVVGVEIAESISDIQ